MKVGFTGSRSATILNEKILDLLEGVCDDDIIIHGGARGADTLIAEYCKLHKIKQEIIRPINSVSENYLRRNIEIITKCDKLIAYWDGKSRGTKFTIDYAKARNKEVIIVRI